MDEREMMDIVMQAAADYVMWRREFLAAWYEGRALAEMKMQFAGISPDFKDMLKEQAPKPYEGLNDLLTRRY